MSAKRQQVCVQNLLSQARSLKLTLISISPSADERPLRCIVCQPKVSGFHFCRHVVDPESRLYILLKMTKGWDHSKVMQALDAYADFLTLKFLEEDYDDTLLLPPDTIKEVKGGGVGWPRIMGFCSAEELLHVVIRCGTRTPSPTSCTSPAWTTSLAASTSTTSLAMPLRRRTGSSGPSGAYCCHRNPRECTGLIGSCGRTRLAYKVRFGHEVPEDNEAWAFGDVGFSVPEPIECHFPDGTGMFTSRTVLISRDATVAKLLDSLDIPDDARKGLEPLNAPLTTRIRAIYGNYSGRSRASVLFVGPADVARRALSEDTRRTTQIFIRNHASSAHKRSLVFRVDVSEHGDFVIELKRMVQEHLGIPPSLQRILYAGKQLKEYRRLGDYGVSWNSSLEVLLRSGTFSTR
jgi:hypothetical protein